MSPLERLTVGARIFCIAVILGLGILARDAQTLLSLAVIATVASTAIYLSLATPIAIALIVTVEAAITGLMIALVLPGGVVFLPYLVVLALIAGVTRGLVGVSAAVVAQFSAFLVITLIATPAAHPLDVYRALGPWLITSIGAGLLGAWLAHSGRLPRTSEDVASYESAHRLLTQLRVVARRLSTGLDVISLGRHVLELVKPCFMGGDAVLYLRTEGGSLSPLVHAGKRSCRALAPDQPVVADCWAEMEPLVRAGESGFVSALPLRVGSRVIGVVLAHTEATPSTDKLRSLMPRLDVLALRLDTAMIFDAVRSIAMVEERRRLAREIHDGVAQEVASLGYVVDDLLSTAETAAQRESLSELRQQLTRLVNELRLSIFDLRSAVAPESGLGSALAEYVQQISPRSDMTLHLTLDEGATRLRTDVESEMLRIAQEAITNARKHSDAENLWVHCKVDPPFAALEIRDDGLGLSAGRADSYGLRIMRERAQRIDAQLKIESAFDRFERPGTLLRVTLGEQPSSVSRHSDEATCYATGLHDRPPGRRPRLDPTRLGEGVRAIS